MGRRKLSPEQIADGRGHPSVAELIALVHRANPSDRRLAPAEEAARYALKARLQSRLVRDFADHLDFRWSDREAEIVAIDHRGRARDAAHVPLAALDPDARAIVEGRLAGPADAAPLAVAPALVEPPPTDPFAAGRRALDAWDLPAAHAWLTAAFAERRSEPAAHALAALLVDRLALDAEVLALDLREEHLTARVSRLVALAAARSGAIRRATDLLPRLEPGAEAEVRLLLADAALAAADAGAVRAHLAALRHLDPANGACSRLEDGLRALDGARSAPLEAAVRAAAEPAAIRAAADALLAEFPGHAGARAALARLAEAERRESADRELALADRAAAEGQWDAALRHLRRAQDHGADVRSRGEAVRAARTADRADRAVADALRALQGGDLRPYAALSTAARAAVRERCADPRLGDLEALFVAGARDPVAALEAWAQAEAIVDDQPDAALSLLRRAHLDPLGPLRPLRERIAARQQEAAAARAHGLAEQIVSAAKRGAFAEIRAAIGALRPDLLTPERLAEVDDAREAAEQDAAARREVELFDAEMRIGAVFNARDRAARHLRARPADPEWSVRAAVAEQRTAGILPWRTVEAWEEDLYAVTPPPLRESADACLERDGLHAWLSEGCGRFVFLRRVEIASGRIVGCVVTRLLADVRSPRTVVLEDADGAARIGFASAAGVVGVVAIDAAGAMERWVGFADSPGNRDPIAAAEVNRDGTAVFRCESAVYRRRDVCVTFSPYGLGVSIVGARAVVPIAHPVAGPALLELGEDLLLCLVRTNGERVQYVGTAARLDSAAAAPAGTGVVCVGQFLVGSVMVDGIARLDDQNGVLAAFAPLPDSDARPVATARACACCFVLLEPSPGRREVRAFDADLRPLWTISDPGIAHLLCDAADEHAAVVFQTARGPRIVSLGATPPPIPAGTIPPRAPPVLAPERRDPPPWSEPWAQDASALRVRERLEAMAPDASPAARFAWLDEPEVWELGELTSLSCVAAAAIEWEDGPWAQRLHAVARFRSAVAEMVFSETTVFTALMVRHHELVQEMPPRAADWLDAQADAMGLSRPAPVEGAE